MPSPQCPSMPQHANGSLNIHIFDVYDVHSCTWAAAAWPPVGSVAVMHILAGGKYVFFCDFVIALIGGADLMFVQR
jgi:hypothetical protein